ncbi:transglutaminase-like putative cysteine protease [Povalibacter uvarum]|uniref:Transglutaminase-like putative cysteine protease n=1 Tax=Povalibacter uvarum TaxID=732238 RepID=A0A841HMP4_9GAMM|nr:transglutaminase family protein [Povalibacter uvarum]MBB6094531.1 transglutaminase-like putative cysteine protease [Povalibacter uvarum]
MQLHIRHETLYRYGEPVKRSVQNLRLTPRRDPVQRALDWSISAPGRQHEQIDAYGNVVHLLTLDEPHREIRIVVQGIVETQDTEGEPMPNEGKLSPLTYLAETNLTRADAALQEFAVERMPRSGDRRAGLLRLANAVSDTIGYESGATDVHESAARAFSRGKGVCQDHAHVFIACCRASGIPARYVSGYVYTGKDGEVASHAWADAWLGPDHGWIPIDVTHRTFVGGRHCRLAVGRDYLDACPVRGVRRGGGPEEMQVAVIVAASAQQ